MNQPGQSTTNEVSASQDTAKNAFDFYNTYLSVIYGLLATQGLTSVVTFTKDDEQTWHVLSILLFAGTFITVMRLWLSLANLDDVSRRAYGVIANFKYRRFNFLLMVDSTFATTFAGLLSAMFLAIPSETRFFTLLLWLAGLGLLYESVLGFFFYRFTKQVGGDTNHHEYKAKIIDWIKQGFGFAAAGTALYLFSARLHLDDSVPLALTFVLLTIVQLVVQLFPHWGDAIRKFLGRSGAQT
jgi:hypothetical protein